MEPIEERLGPYRVVREIGAGGMSRVYLGERDDGAFSLQVAIKVMRAVGRDRSEYEHRFEAERQILASFDHPEIARVLDGGVTRDGSPYLVMEHVDGQPLTRACEDGQLSLDRRLALFIQVCSAVHYAHQRLVVHRDIKPSNVLVTADGQVKLLDFGIAKLLQGAGLDADMPATRTGLRLLTPEYAAPEQIRGEEVTTATDVYALGVMLYELVSGRRPYRLADKTPSQIEEIVCDTEPAMPSIALSGAEQQPVPWAPGRVRGDLDTVVLKALAKEPGDRYGSVRELAQELERYLAGEPVAARPVGRVSRLWRKARRRPRVALAGLAATLVFSILGSVTLYTRFTAEERARTAQRFGQEIEQIDALLQRAYLVPLHDIRPDLVTVRARMTKIEQEIGTLSPGSRPVAHYALGRGHLGLGEDESARAQLQSAWDAGYRQPEVANALGQALSNLYRAGLEQLPAISPLQLREERRAELERLYRDPAMTLLEQAGAAEDQGSLASATLDYFAGRPAAALAALESLHEHSPWFYEAELLTGDIHSESYRAAVTSGESGPAAEHLGRAAEAFAAASRIGRSDPRPYQGLCGLWADELNRQYYGTQADLDGVRDTALGHCRNALTADNDRAPAHLRIGQISRLWADRVANLGEDPRPMLEQARSSLRRAADIDPTDSGSWVVRGATFRTEATWMASQGEDPTPAYEQALASYDQAIAIEPTSYRAHSSRSATWFYLGDFQRRRGRDSQRHFENAIDDARKAVARVPDLVSGYVNLGIALEQLAILRRDRGQDAEALFAEGAEALEKAIAINPEFYTAHYNLGELLLERGALLLAQGSDPTGLVEQALPLLNAAEQAWPDWAPTFFLQARGQILLARWAVASGGDPGSALSHATARVETGLAIGSSDSRGYVTAAQVHLTDAAWRLGRSESPEPPVVLALDRLQQALAINPDTVDAHKRVAEAFWLRGRWLTDIGGDVRPVATEGLAAAALAVVANPLDAEALLFQARLELLRGSISDDGKALQSAVEAARLAIRIRAGYREAEAVLRDLQTTEPGTR